jgi:hypothetical protein
MVANQVAAVMSAIMIIAMPIPINTLPYMKVGVVTAQVKVHASIARVTVMLILIVTKVFIAGREIILLATFIIVMLVEVVISAVMIIALIL